jgi:hypothetical protein
MGGLIREADQPGTSVRTTARGATAARATCFDVTEGDAALVQVVRREFERDLVTGEDANVVLLHLARRVGNQLSSVTRKRESGSTS